MKNLEKRLFVFALLLAVSLASFSFVAGQTATPDKNARKTNAAAALRAKKKKGKIKPAMNQTNKTPVAAGAWGANGIALDVNETGATIEYDCATGAITEKLTIDGDGNFSAAGTHTRLAPGPIRVGHEPQAQSAHYTGKISGETMTLKIVLDEGGALVGEYALEKGKTPRLHRCL